MSAVVWSDAARDDLLDIYEYIAVDSPLNADRFIDKIQARANRLAAAPGVGRARPEFGVGIRSLAIGNYLLIYRVVRGSVQVARVISAHRDLTYLWID